MSLSEALKSSRLIGRKEVEELLGISRAKLVEQVEKNPRFPQPIKVSPQKFLYDLAEVLSFREYLLAQRDAGKDNLLPYFPKPKKVREAA
jgi:predicted DNA-binding transcriptional regulator AlpA